MALVELIVADAVASCAMTLTLKHASKYDRRRNSVMRWRQDGQSIRGLDPWMKKMSGSARTEREASIARWAIRGSRWTVNRKSFEYLVQGLVNANSPLRRKLPGIGRWVERMKKKWEGSNVAGIITGRRGRHVSA